MPHPNDHAPDLARDMAGSEAPPCPVDAAGPGAGPDEGRGPDEHAASDALAQVEVSIGDLADEIEAICGDPDPGTPTDPDELRTLAAAIEELDRETAEADPGLPPAGIGPDESPRELKSAVTESSGPDESAVESAEESPDDAIEESAHEAAPEAMGVEVEESTDEAVQESTGKAVEEEMVTGKDAVEAGVDIDLDAVDAPDVHPPLDDADPVVPPAAAAGEETGPALAAPPPSDDDEPSAASRPLVTGASTLQQIDDLLAGDAEELLAGNFATVSAVLDDAEPNQGEVVAGTGPEDEPAATPGPAASSRPGLDDDSSLMGGTFEEPEPGSEPGSVLLPASSIPQTHPATEDAAPVDQEPPGIPIPDPIDPHEDLLPDPARVPNGIVRLVVAALRIMGLPLTFVPPRFRPIVDWVALSLVFWVPIVWVVALFVVGR